MTHLSAPYIQQNVFVILLLQNLDYTTGRKGKATKVFSPGADAIEDAKP